MSNLQRKYKIALVGYRLSGGGAEKVMANLSLFLSNKGLDVHIYTVIDEFGFPYGGKIFSTRKTYFRKGFLSRIARFGYFYYSFKREKYDFIIDFRFRTKIFQEFLISNIIYRSPTIYTIHSSKIDCYIPKNKFFANLIYKNFKALVSVSKYIEDQIAKEYRFENLNTIYNSIDLVKIDELADENLSLDFTLNDFILGVGQINDSVKQMDHLIYAYSKSEIDKHLVICGEGKLKEKYLDLVKKIGLEEKIHFVGFQSNPYKYMKRAKFLVLTSKFEGFGNVLVESLACNTPVLSYDCYSGPNEIIQHEFNGLLVKNQCIDSMSKSIKRMNDDIELYKNCKKNSRSSISKFSLEKIGEEWCKLLGIQ